MILIDMKMPNKCYNCPCYGINNNCMVNAKSLDDEFPWNDTPGWCPLMESPTKKGHWIGNELGECSVCGHKGCGSDIWNGCKNTYCPNCGAYLTDIR